MIIVAHRINTIEELKKVPTKYGVEIDIRSYCGKLILNHEPHVDGDLLEEYLKSYQHSFIIFNVKEAGIENEIIELAQKYNINNYFLLDVEYPFIYQATIKQKFKKIAIRYSEAEPIEFAEAHKNLLDWVWIDTNTKLPLNDEIYQKIKNSNLKMALVSPDRWGRPEEIDQYKKELQIMNIQIDLVMVELALAKKWE